MRQSSLIFLLEVIIQCSRACLVFLELLNDGTIEAPRGQVSNRPALNRKVNYARDISRKMYKEKDARPFREVFSLTFLEYSHPY